MLPKDLYSRLTCWMADNEDSSLLEESMPKDDVNQYLLDEAMDIMYQIHLLEMEQDVAKWARPAQR